MRGADVVIHIEALFFPGLSPRVWGRRRVPIKGDGAVGTIPAYAGPTTSAL